MMLIRRRAFAWPVLLLACVLIVACVLVGGYLGRAAYRSGDVARSPKRPAARVAVDARVRTAEAGVVEVVSLQASCRWQVQSTGFAISPHHVIVLASNVEGSAKGGLHVVSANGMPHTARVVLFDPTLDIAVLDVPTLSVPALGFASTFVPYSRVAFIGYVHGGPRPTVTTGIATASGAVSHGLYGSKVGLQQFQVQAKAGEGESGAPVLNQAGQVDGILDGNAPGSSSHAYALSNMQIQSDAAQGADRSTVVSAGRCVSNQK
jgi:S1-C subfamily serine protease